VEEEIDGFVAVPGRVDEDEDLKFAQQLQEEMFREEAKQQIPVDPRSQMRERQK
jgi:hypothetical protein